MYFFFFNLSLIFLLLKLLTSVSNFMKIILVLELIVLYFLLKFYFMAVPSPLLTIFIFFAVIESVVSLILLTNMLHMLGQDIMKAKMLHF